MEQVVSKTSGHYYFVILLLLLLGTAPFLIDKLSIPFWASCIFWILGFSLFFGIKTTTFTDQSITVKFILLNRLKTITREEIDHIDLQISAGTVAQRTGIMKKDQVLKIVAEEKRKSISITDRFHSSFNEALEFVKRNYPDKINEYVNS
ncbi:MAG: hypothetical protein HUJ25_01910 [Crocinitomicaceae bacterium]|nr:hypothetical protein [Crocinitomicaceae bacterium]